MEKKRTSVVEETAAAAESWIEGSQAAFSFKTTDKQDGGDKQQERVKSSKTLMNRKPA